MAIYFWNPKSYTNCFINYYFAITFLDFYFLISWIGFFNIGFSIFSKYHEIAIYALIFFVLINACLDAS